MAHLLALHRHKVVARQPRVAAVRELQHRLAAVEAQLPQLPPVVVPAPHPVPDSRSSYPCEVKPFFPVKEVSHAATAQGDVSAGP